MGLENPLHIAIVLVVVLMVFGAKPLPEMGKGLGEGMRGFKQAISGENQESIQSTQVHTEPAPTQQPGPLALSAAPAPAPTAAPERESAPVA